MNTVYIAKSLDGYIAGKNGDLDWLHSIPNPDNLDFGFNDFQKKIDALVMGRATFDVVCSFGGDWPYQKPVFVLSNSLKTVPKKYADQASIVTGTPLQIVKDLHKKGFENLYIDGGKTIQSFLAEDLIDELIITTLPLLLGGGTPLFQELEQPLNFTHQKTEVLLNEMVMSHYVRKK